ncbi:hypothetical protein BDV36DRAFT_246381 [Aspergillus pseudocaelatus]|uniref:Secreted protein n=1 Tax=Aspergillus pseudocaelatus TaxID=1825620 RepID=A0ABQ6X047_9EURO|nr:hypothetical protein BDV36DRAFT_246381 [Aspergillus pseudocaelatus]
MRFKPSRSILIILIPCIYIHQLPLLLACTFAYFPTFFFSSLVCIPCRFAKSTITPMNVPSAKINRACLAGFLYFHWL